MKKRWMALVLAIVLAFVQMMPVNMSYVHAKDNELVQIEEVEEEVSEVTEVEGEEAEVEEKVSEVTEAVEVEEAKIEEIGAEEVEVEEAEIAQAEEYRKCGNNLEWEIDESGCLVISGTGEMYDFDLPSYSSFEPETETIEDNAPWEDYVDEIFSVSIESGVTSIGKNAFHRMTLNYVDLSNTVEKIGDDAFYGSSLVDITLPASVKVIGNNAFSNCFSLEDVQANEGLVEIGDRAFIDCFELSYFKIPGSVTKIGEKAFDSDTTLRVIEDSYGHIYADLYEYEYEFVECNHSYDEGKVIAPTCTEEGYTIYTCKYCGSTKEYQRTDALGHDLDSQKVCKNCGQNFSAVLETPAVSLNRDAAGIKIEWEEIPEATEYEVWRSSDSEDWEMLDTVTELEYLDDELEYGETYSYKVKAIAVEDGIEREGDFSEEVTSVVDSISKPNSLTVKCVGYTSLRISWSKVVPATGYQIYRSTSKDGTYKRIKTISDEDTLTYKDTGLKTGQKYYYKVRAVYESEKGKYSSVKNSTPNVKAPEIKTLAYSTKSTITVRWNKVTGANGYYIYRKTTSSGEWKRVKTVKGGSEESYKFTDLNGRYYFSVKAYRTVDGEKIAGPRSETVRLATLGKTKITVDQYEDDLKQIVTWNKVSKATGYKVYRKVGSKGEWKCVKTTTSTSYTASVNHGSYYYWKVRPIFEYADSVTWGPYSEEDNLLIYYYPEYSVVMSDDYDPETYAIAMAVTNHGVGKMRIFSRNACYIDDVDSGYDRYLHLVETESGYYEEISYVDIMPGETEIIMFEVEDYSTWYSPYAAIGYEFWYDGVYYIGVSSAYYGSAYEILDK